MSTYQCDSHKRTCDKVDAAVEEIAKSSGGLLHLQRVQITQLSLTSVIRPPTKLGKTLESCEVGTSLSGV